MVKLYDEENRKLLFGISKVDRNQDDKDDIWWNVKIVFKNRWINFDENRESFTELELKEIADEIEKGFIKKEKNNSESFSFIEPDYQINFKPSIECAILIINIEYANSINIYLNKEELIKIYNYICDTLNYKR